MSGTDDSGGTTGSVDGVLITPELARRPTRAPDHVAENRALGALAGEMAASPGTVLFITGYAGGKLPRGAEVIGKPFGLDTLAHRVQALLVAGRAGCGHRAAGLGPPVAAGLRDRRTSTRHG